MPQALEYIVDELADLQEHWQTKSITAGLTLTEIDSGVVILADATSLAINVTLPSAALNVHRVVVVKKTDASVNQVNVLRAGSDTIDGATTYALTTQYDRVGLVSDGTNWNILFIT